MNLFDDNHKATYVVTQTSWSFVTRFEDGTVIGWPERVLTPRLSREDAVVACKGLQSRTVANPGQYAIQPAWAWERNQEWRDKGLSEAAKIPDYVPTVPASMVVPR